jgi:hypothetical protein
MPRREQGGWRAKRDKTCRSRKAGTAPISTAKSQIGTVPYIVLVHACGGSIPPIVDFVHVGPRRIARLRDFSCVVGAALRCWSVGGATEARFTALTAARRTPGGKRNVKPASVTKRAGAVA